MVRFQLLGDVTAANERGPVALGSARQRAVLAVLLVEPGTVVSLYHQADRVWGTKPPRNVRQTLHTYVSRLRGALGDADGPRLERHAGGYALAADTSAVDLHRFRALVAEARAADDARAAGLFEEAMGLWRGEPFAGLDSDWLRSVAVTLEAERLSAVLDHNEVLLRAGEHARLLPSVAEAARTRPLDERLAAQLLLALYRCGRQAEALEHYRQFQERLGDELGADPGPELRDLHQRILRHDPELTAGDAAQGGTAGDHLGHDSVRNGGVGSDDRPPAPAQLPLDVTGFTGRVDNLRHLDELPSGATTAGRKVVVVAISGTAGVGKTALAVHWAHRVADQFPDGQLHVNLRGYDPGQPVRPTDALARFLTALGVPERDIPLDEDDRAARYRSELAERRMLIVLDNASSVAQVRPLLPGGGSSLVVVTSRDGLAGLVALHGAHQVRLDLLTPGESVGLLHRLIGDRVAADRVAAETLAEQCARLPLALRVAAVLATSRPEQPLAEVVAELADRQDRLQLLDPGGDPYAAVQTVFSWSIQQLPDDVARTFRRLGLHPGPDLDPYVAAALTGLEPSRARQVLEDLVAAHLLYRVGNGRYAMHDLLRAYATHLTATEDDDETRSRASNRLLDYYRTAAYYAVRTIYPAEVLYQLGDAPDVSLPDLSAPTPARGWLQVERACLVAVAEYAADQGEDQYAVGLAVILHRYVNVVHPVDLFAVNAHALRAAEEADNSAGRAHVLRQLGVGHSRASRFETAREHFDQALALFRQIGDLAGEAHTLTNLAALKSRCGDNMAAREGHYRALAVAQRSGDRYATATVYNNVVAAEAALGNLAEADEACRRALAIFQDIGARHCEAIALFNLANTELDRGEYTTAGDRLRRCLASAEALDMVSTQAHVLDSLGTLHLRLEEPDEAESYFRRALDVCHELGDVSGQAWSCNGLGEAAQLAGNAAGGLRWHVEALGIATQVGARDQEARAHAGIGHAHRMLGSLDEARSHYERAHATYTELGMPEAEEMRAHLDETRETAARAGRPGGEYGPVSGAR
jgi:DNA-binding SARP family transcriptional activator/Tfp pilus assembly protein PilF